MKNNKIIVLGESGFLASHLVDLIEKKKKEIIVFDRIKKRKNSKKLKFIKGNILDKKRLLKNN